MATGIVGVRRLAVILHADVVDSTRLVQRDETLAHSRITHAFRRFAKAVRSYGGTVHEVRGDALVAQFPRASDAIGAALAFQRAEASRGKQEDDGIVPRLRIGIALGEVVIADETVTGPGVVLAQRVEQLAAPGGVCATAAVVEATPGRLPFDYSDLGPRPAKGFDEPVHVYGVALRPGAPAPAPEPLRARPALAGRGRATLAAAAALIVALGVAVWMPFREPAPEGAGPPEPVAEEQARPAVAVLPFVNLSDDRQQEYFADGITDDLITDLSKISGLFVAARNSAFTYKGKNARVDDIARDLDVRYVLEGSVRRVGERLRINVQLTDTRVGHHVWAERYDDSKDKVFELQEALTRETIAALAVELTPQERASAHTSAGTGDVLAYDALLQGWELLRRQSPESFVEARDRFERALELDPDYARAKVSLAAVYWWGAWNGWHLELGHGFQESISFAENYLPRAMEPPSPLGHRLAAEMHLWRDRHQEAVAEAQRAIALDPNDPDGYEALATTLAFSGRAEQALDSVRLAMSLNPKGSSQYLKSLGRIEFLLGRFEEAAATLERAVAFEPSLDLTYRWLIAAYGHLDRLQDATAAIRRIDSLRERIGRPSLTLLETEATLLREAADKARLREGWRRAGVPPGTARALDQIALEWVARQLPDRTYDVRRATRIDVGTAKTLYDRGAVFIDGRTTSWPRGHIEGAVLLSPLVTTRAQLAAIAGEDDEVVFYCSGFT